MGGSLVYMPITGDSGVNYASFTFQAKDDGGTANGGVDLDQSPNTITINVSLQHHNIVGQDNTVTTNEDTARTFAAADFPFTDQDGDQLLAVRIATLPARGTLTLSGSPVVAGQLIPVADINLGNLKFVPDANANGAAYGSFTFQLKDDGGTANGGSDLDPTPATMTVNVTSVNDAPAGFDHGISVVQSTSRTLSLADFALTDPMDNPTNSLLAVKIGTLSIGGGTLVVTGSGPVTENSVVQASDIAAGKLVFTAPSTADDLSFAFQVQDDGGTRQWRH